MMVDQVIVPDEVAELYVARSLLQAVLSAPWASFSEIDCEAGVVRDFVTGRRFRIKAQPLDF